MKSEEINFYQIDEVSDITVTLSGSEPAIYRQLQVRSDISLFELHCIIQIALGWTHSHLYQFIRGDLVFGILMDDFKNDFPDTIDANHVPLAGVLKRPGQVINYLYDFGDHWEHKVQLNRHLPTEKDKFYPVCIAGEGVCPPEDCGGIHGYYEMMEVLKDANHPEHKDTKTWAGRNYLNKQFDLIAVNKKLRKIKSVVREFYSAIYLEK
jgi:hypothetical protein